MERRPKRVVWHFGQLAGLPPTVGTGSAVTRLFCRLAGLLGVLVERGILGITGFAPCFINLGFPRCTPHNARALRLWSMPPLMPDG